MQKLLGFVEYFGKGFSGWQAQANPKILTVYQTLKSGVHFIYRKKLASQQITKLQLIGASRTDTGVHALRNSFHIQIHALDHCYILSPEVTQRALNNYFIKNGFLIKVVELVEVDMDFNCRMHAKARHYIYKIATSSLSVFQRDFYWQVLGLDMDKLREGCIVISNYTSLDNLIKIKQDQVVDNPELKIEAEILGDKIHLHFRARRFFWHQVRFMTGAIAKYATGQISLEVLNEMANGLSKNKPYLAPAKGLYLAEVIYDIFQQVKHIKKRNID